jgi:hypothetical protein
MGNILQRNIVIAPSNMTLCWSKGFFCPFFLNKDSLTRKQSFWIHSRELELLLVSFWFPTIKHFFASHTHTHNKKLCFYNCRPLSPVFNAAPLITGPIQLKNITVLVEGVYVHICTSNVDKHTCILKFYQHDLKCFIFKYLCSQ